MFQYLVGTHIGMVVCYFLLAVNPAVTLTILLTQWVTVGTLYLLNLIKT
jgi:hypothetical protein